MLLPVWWSLVPSWWATAWLVQVWSLLAWSEINPTEHPIHRLGYHVSMMPQNIRRHRTPEQSLTCRAMPEIKEPAGTPSMVPSEGGEEGLRNNEEQLVFEICSAVPTKISARPSSFAFIYPYILSIIFEPTKLRRWPASFRQK